MSGGAKGQRIGWPSVRQARYILTDRYEEVGGALRLWVDCSNAPGYFQHNEGLLEPIRVIHCQNRNRLEALECFQQIDLKNAAR